jgi:hypothetical protein
MAGDQVRGTCAPHSKQGIYLKGPLHLAVLCSQLCTDAASISPATNAVRLNCSAMAPLPSRRLLIGFETGRPIGCPARRSCERYVPRIAEVTASLRMSISAVALQGGGDTDVNRKADRCCHLRACTIETNSRLHAITKPSPQTHSQQATEEAVMRRRSRIHCCTGRV